MNHHESLVARLCFAAALALAAGATALVGYTQQLPQVPISASGTGGGVHGSIVVQVHGQPDVKFSESRDSFFILLPDFEVFLKDVETGQLSEPVKTDLFGRFVFPWQKAGTYELRWKEQAGWKDGALGKRIVVKSSEVYSGPVEITPQTGLGLVLGRVVQADG